MWDFIALYTVLGGETSAARRPFRVGQELYAGTELAFQVFRGLELLGVQFEETHPSASDRLALVRGYARAHCATEDDWVRLSALADNVDAVFTEVVKVIDVPVKRDPFFQHAGAQLVDQLNQLLDACVGDSFDQTPNFARFHAEAPNIFGGGYSHLLLGELSALGRRLSDPTTRPADGGKSQTFSEAIRDFQKVMLLYHFVDKRLREPGKSLFIQALLEPIRDHGPWLP